MCSQVHYVKQTVGNACGTLALLHAILSDMNRLPIRPESFLSQFYSRTTEMTPMKHAKFLEDPKEGGDPDIETAHQVETSLDAGQLRRTVLLLSSKQQYREIHGRQELMRK